MQVLKKRLAMNEPSVMCGNLGYEEGADLEEDEVEANQKLLGIPLDQLPGGGITNGSIVMVSDQAQDFSCQLVVTFKVCSPGVVSVRPLGRSITGAFMHRHVLTNRQAKKIAP